MRRYQDSCQSRRAAADLLRWSMGSEPRHGKGYGSYQEPANPAKRPLTAKSVARSAGWYSRILGVNALAGFLRWALSITEPRQDRKSSAE